MTIRTTPTIIPKEPKLLVDPIRPPSEIPGTRTTVAPKTMDVDLSRASIAGQLPRPTGEERFIPPTILQPKKTEVSPPEVKITDRAWVTLPATSVELQTIATAKERGLCVGAMKSYYTVKTYQVALKGGGVIYVEALGKTEAEKKAKNAGYKVAYISSRSSTWAPTGEAVVQPGESASSGTVTVKDGKTGATLQIPTEQWEALGDKYQTIVKTRGFDTMLSIFEFAHVKSSTGEYMARTDFYGLQNYDKTNNTTYAETFKNQGYAAYTQAVNADVTAQQNAVDKLKDYKVEDGYDVERFITEKPTQDSVDTLKKAGFDNETITACQQYADLVQGFFSDMGRVKLGTSEKQYADVDYGNIDTAALNRALLEVKGFGTTTGAPTFRKLSDEDKIKVAAYYIGDAYKGKNILLQSIATSETIKRSLPASLQWAVVGAEVVGFILAPQVMMPLVVLQGAASMGARASVGEKVEPMEIAMTSLMATAAVLPYVGPVISRTMGATGKIGLTATHIGITGAFLAGSVPTLMSKDVPLYDKAAAVLFDAMMIRSLGAMALSKVAGRKAEGATLGVDLKPDQQLEILRRVLRPVSGLTVKERNALIQDLKNINTGLLDIKKQVGHRSYQIGGKKYVGFIDQKTIGRAQPAVNEVVLAYNEMMSRVGEYANAALKWKQAQKAISDYGLAKSKAELKILDEYKAREAELSDRLKTLKDPMVKATEKYTESLLKNTKGLETQEREAIRDMPKEIARDMDSLTSQLFAPRDAKVIAKDIKELEGQIVEIEREIKKDMSPEQVEACGKLVTILKSQIADLVVDLRLREVGAGEKVNLESKKLTMQVESLQVRLEKAIAALQSFKGSALDYPTFRKGELAVEAEVVKAERDIMEGIQRTTEPIWGKESYAFVLEKLNANLDSLVSLMRKAGVSPDRAVKLSFDLYEAIKAENPKALKEAVRLLQLEAGKIKDKALQLKASEQVKLLETLTAEKVMARFRGRETAQGYKLTKEDVYKTVAETSEEGLRIELRKAAERIIERRLEDLMKSVPSYMERQGMGKIMDYLRRTIDRDFFRDKGFEDIDDYLDVHAEIERRYQKQLELDRQRGILAAQEAERDMAKKRLSETTGPALKETLDNHVRELEKSIEKQKIDLAEAAKTVSPLREVIETTKTPEERKQAITTSERGLTVTEKTSKEKMAEAKSTEKAKRQIRAAEKELTKEPEKKRESAFPGISSVSKTGSPWTIVDYRTQTTYVINEDGSITQYDPMTGTRTIVKLNPAIQVSPAIREAVKTAVKTYVQTLAQLQTLTKTQLQTKAQTATQTAVQTVLRRTTKTITKLQLERLTRLITRQITEIRPPQPPRVLPPRMQNILSQRPREKIPREGPALAVWKQGAYWVSIFPPFRTTGRQEDVVYSRERPKWGSVIAKGRHAPKRTLRSMGRVPELITVPMGVVTARIRGGRHLSFSRSNGRKRGRVIE
jgi:hypothetical protein